MTSDIQTAILKAMGDGRERTVDDVYHKLKGAGARYSFSAVKEAVATMREKRMLASNRNNAAKINVYRAKRDVREKCRSTK